MSQPEEKKWTAEEKLQVLRKAYRRLEQDLQDTKSRTALLEKDRKVLSEEVSQLKSANEAMAEELELACNSMEDKSLPMLASGKPPTFKVVVAGCSSVGKSCLAYFFAHGRSQLDHGPTHGGSQLRAKGSFKIKQKPLMLEVWDTEGQWRGARALDPYAKGSDAIMMVFDVTDLKTLSELDNRFVAILEGAKVQDPVVVVLGNKADQLTVRPEGFEAALATLLQSIKGKLQSYASSAEVPPFLSYYEVSAKSGQNCAEVMQQLELQIAYRKVFGGKKGKDDGVVDMHKKDPKKGDKGGKCC